MQIYTKIFIGMALGVVYGFFLGPESRFFEHDLIKAPDASRVTLLASPGGAPTGVKFPKIEDGAIGAQLKVLEERGSGKKRYYKVELKVTKRMVMAGGRLKVGDRLTGWVDASTVPVPKSSVGEVAVAIVAPLGKLFLRLIKMVIIPLVFASLLVGVASLGDPRKLGRLGGKTLGYFLLTTTLAVTIGLTVANVFNPGRFLSAEDKQALVSQYQSDAQGRSGKAAKAPSAVDNVLGMIPTNPLKSMVENDMLQVIFFAAFFGVALTFIERKKAQSVVVAFEAVNDAMIKIVEIVMKLAPIGVFALVAEVLGRSGFGVIGALLAYIAAVLISLAIHVFAVYASVVRIFGKIRLKNFFKAARPAQLVAFSTSSSSATLPVTMECAEENLGVSGKIASFVLPLGSTVNMDGTAIYQGVAAVFIAQVFDIPLTLGDQLSIVIAATLASIGAAGVPGVGIVTLALVLSSINVPTVGIALVLGVDRILDMFRTAVNVTGDLSATVLVASTEGEKVEFREPVPTGAPRPISEKWSG